MGVFDFLAKNVCGKITEYYEKIRETRREKVSKKETAECVASEQLAKITLLPEASLQTLSLESLSLIGSKIIDIYSEEIFYIQAVKAGNKNAEQLLVQQAELCNPKATPYETIAHCNEVNALVPNAMCYYRKGVALVNLGREDEAILALETAMSLDTQAENSFMHLSCGARGETFRMLATLKNKARKKCMEKEGRYEFVKTGVEYEDFVCSIIRRIGYVCKKTPVTDQGVDIVVSLKSGYKLAVQCKFLSVPVSNSAVQEVVAGKALYKCRYACVIGKSGYTKAAIELAKANDVWLIRHDEIQDCITTIERRNPT